MACRIFTLHPDSTIKAQADTLVNDGMADDFCLFILRHEDLYWIVVEPKLYESWLLPYQHLLTPRSFMEYKRFHKSLDAVYWVGNPEFVSGVERVQ